METFTRKQIDGKVIWKKIMDSSKIKKFIMFYERITKNMLKNLNDYDAVISIDKKHRLKKIIFN